jgi:hypothetical protein
MPSDLIASIQRMVTPDLISKIAGSLGQDKSAVNQAVAAGIPAILAGLAGVADSSAGAQRISNVLSQSPTSLDDIKSAFTGGDQQDIADHGASVLSSLLGNSTLKSLATALSAYAGVGQSSGTSLLGLLAPLVLGVLGQKQRTLGLDGPGIAHLLAGQKDAIAAALPSGFSNLLKGTGILDAVGGGFKDATGRAGASAGAAYERMTPPPLPPKEAGMSGWAMAGVALAALAGPAWFMSGPQSEEVAQATATGTPVEGRAVATPNDMAPRVTLQVTSTVAGLRATLQDIKDAGTATAAVPKLGELSANLDRVQGLAAQLPADSRNRVAEQVQSSLPAINQLLDQVMANPETAAIARSVIEPLRTKLSVLAAT